jgi:hypothetical protein
MHRSTSSHHCATSCQYVQPFFDRGEMLDPPVDYFLSPQANSYSFSTAGCPVPIRSNSDTSSAVRPEFPWQGPFQPRSAFCELQRDKQHWNRPPSAASAIACMLLHPIFGKFINDYENYEPTAADSKLVWTLSAAISSFFKDEATRASKFREIPPDSGIHASVTTIEGNKFISDSDVQSQGFRRVIIEFKNKIGSKGAESHAQAISYYIHATKSSVTMIPSFIFPCILITLSRFFTVSYLQCPQPLQVPISTSRLLFGALVRTYRCFLLPCP